MLKTIENTRSIARPKKNKVKISGNNMINSGEIINNLQKEKIRQK